jgi:hypothetical protein
VTQAVPENLRELQLLCAQSPPNKVRFGMIFATTHDQRVACVEEAIDWISQEHTKTRQHRQDRDEDALTIDIITDLKALGFDASHDKDYGGHGDIVIEARDNFLWIGEAKIHGAYEWLLKGFQQLDTRYSTGLPGQEHGGLIIYCKGRDVEQVMVKWIEYLQVSRPDVTIDSIVDQPLVRRSQHTHATTGRLFKVRHVPISLYHEPQDKPVSVKRTVAKAKAKRASAGRRR